RSSSARPRRTRRIRSPASCRCRRRTRCPRCSGSACRSRSSGPGLVRWAAPTVAAHLPRRPAALALRDYGVLGSVRHPWPVTVWSALLGAASHLMWDGFTHDPRGHGWLSAQICELQRDGLFGLPWWVVTDHLSTVLGA